MRLSIFMLLSIALLGCIAPEGTVSEPAAEISEEPVEEKTEEIPVEENASEEESIAEEKNETEEEIIGEEAIEEDEPVAEAKPEGIFFGGGRYILIIDDVVWYGDKSCAAVRIAHSNGTTIKPDVMCPLVDYYWISPEGRQFRIKITEVAAGYTGEAWAKAVIYE